MFEVVYSTGILNQGGPDVFTPDIQLPQNRGEFYIEAWISNFGSSNVHILRGAVNLAEAQQKLERGFEDVLMTLTSAGPVCRRLPTDTSQFTIYFEAQNTSGQSQIVTVKIT